jgi:hypothetical protein
MDAVLSQILHRGRTEGSFPLARPSRDARYLRAVLDQAVRDQMSASATTGADEAAGDLFDFAVRALTGRPPA